MILLSDTDILLKLGALDLFDEAMSVLGANAQDFRVLAEAAIYIRKKKNLEPIYGHEGVQRALAFAQSAKIIDAEPDPMEHKTLLDAGLDPGEAVLFAATASLGEFSVLTGDKRAVRALADSPKCNEICRRHDGRVVCLEALLLRILESYDFQVILSKVVAGYECDIAIRSAFGSGMKAQKDTVVRSLLKRLEELDEETGRVLLSMDR